MSWRFVFIDESGDAGLKSPFFVAAAVDCPKEALSSMRRLHAPFRHHLEMHKEVKTAKLNHSGRPRRKACEVLSALIDEGLTCTVVHLDKASYSGPYLGTTGKDPWPTRFRNFVLRQLLEQHFEKYPAGNSHIELVFDRVSMSRKDRDELERYVTGNWKLPTVEYFTHVDSEYTEAIIWPDLVATVVKEHLSGVDESPEAAALRAQLHSVDITAP
jgi:hypothetical protein